MAKQFVVGIDIGGQTSKIGVVDARGDVLAQSVIRSDTFGSDADAYILALADAVKACIRQAGKETEEIRGVGVGAPNGNYYTGEVAFAPNLAWAADKSVLLAKKLSEALDGLPVSLTNDGDPPAEAIKPSGGLLNLLTLCETKGLAMTIESTPAFRLLLEYDS